MLSQQPSEPESLAAYFTDVEYLRLLFQSLASTSVLSKRVLVIHGIGGVGKSSLLRMFRLHCKSIRIPVALTSGDEARSAVAILTNWANDLRKDGLPLSGFATALQRYRAIQAQVNEEAQKKQSQGSKAVDIVGKIAAKTTEATTGAVIGAAVGSVLPGIGTIAGALGGAIIGTSAEELMEFLRSFLAKPDLDLLLDPTKTLTHEFLADVAQVASKKRIVLMLDTLDQMEALDDWARDLIQKLHMNVLMVIAGRAIPSWHRGWQDWLVQADLQELQPMKKRVILELIYRYYATQTGGKPDSAQVKAIIRFARGLPIAVTSAVRLWVKYHSDFRETRAESIDEVVKVLTGNVPRDLMPILEAAATVRYFNKEILRAVTGQIDLDATYDELRRFPFVLPRRDWLQIHDSVREILDEGLSIDDPGRYCELHRRAADYFESRLGELGTKEGALSVGWESSALEMVYHLLRAEPRRGYQVAQEYIALAYHIYRMDLFQQFLGEIKRSKPDELSGPNELYEQARLLHGRYKLRQAERELLSILSSGITNRHADINKDILNSLGAAKYLQGQWRQSKDYFSRSLETYRTSQNIAYTLMWLGRVHIAQGKLWQAEALFNQAFEHLEKLSHKERALIDARIWYSLGEIRSQERHHIDALSWYEKGLYALRQIGAPRETIILLAHKSATMLMMSNTIEGTEIASEALRIAEEIQDERGKGLAKFRLGNLSIAQQQLDTAINLYRSCRASFIEVEDGYFLVQANIRLCFACEMQGVLDEILPLAKEAEEYSKQNGYWDQLANLHLFQARLVWEGKLMQWGVGFDEALEHYQASLICALLHNRFLLDEVLSAHSHKALLQSVISECQRREHEGQQMLVTLRDWWHASNFEVGGLENSDTNLSIPDGIPLLEAECIGREQELGDSSPQKTVIQQIEIALAKSG